LLLLWAVPVLVAYQPHKPSPGTQRRVAVVSGTVFRDPGFAQPGVTVKLARKGQPAKKLQQTTSNYRGEFSFRVPAGPETYIVSASGKGFQPEQQEVAISGEEQANVTLVLSPESKQ
jgi:hypothetical protein